MSRFLAYITSLFLLSFFALATVVCAVLVTDRGSSSATWWFVSVFSWWLVCGFVPFKFGIDLRRRALAGNSCLESPPRGLRQKHPKSTGLGSDRKQSAEENKDSRLRENNETDSGREECDSGSPAIRGDFPRLFYSKKLFGSQLAAAYGKDQQHMTSDKARIFKLLDEAILSIIKERRKLRMGLWCHAFCIPFSRGAWCSYRTDSSRLATCSIHLDSETQESLHGDFIKLSSKFVEAGRSKIVREISEVQDIDRRGTRSSAAIAIDSRKVALKRDYLEIVKCSERALVFPLGRRKELYVYPLCAFLVHKGVPIKALPLQSIKVSHVPFRLQDPKGWGRPRDADIVDHTWNKANKDGSRDKRFKENDQIPIYEFGLLEIDVGDNSSKILMSNEANCSLLASALAKYSRKL